MTRWMFIAAAGSLIVGPAAGALTGVCPDGSIYIVKRADQIPCPGAKTVDPHEVPPIRPQLLPRPYLWQVHQQQNDQNNPYNLVDRADQVRAIRSGGGSAAEGPVATHQPEASAPQVASAPPPVSAAPPPEASLAERLALSDGELRDLFMLVELSQEHAPATFLQETADGRERLRIAFAHSRSFEARLGQTLGLGGPVLLFSAVAKQPEPFHPNFTFVQGHVAFRPQARDPRQLGVLQGRFGQLERDEIVLGYAALPAGIDLSRPIDLYWNDRQLAVTLRP